MIVAGLLDQHALDAIDAENAALIERRGQEAKAAPTRRPTRCRTDVYVSY